MGKKEFFKLTFALQLVVLLWSAVSISGALVDPRLRPFAMGQGGGASESVGGEVTRVVALIKPPTADIARPRRYDRPSVINYYRAAQVKALESLRVSVQNNQLSGVKVVRDYWINGSIVADVTRQGLLNLSAHPAILKIYANARIDNDPFGVNALDEAPSNYAFSSIGLDKLVKEQPRLTGQGVIVGAVDTGVDGAHPALRGKIPLFYNGATKSPGEPKDFAQHGTHVAGTIVGGDRQSNTIGMAPGAKLVMAGVVQQGYDAMIDGMQWFLDVEKNPNVAVKVKAVGCSWNSGGAPDQEVFYRAIAAWEAAGILPVFSAGNAGMGGITNPHEYPGTFAVAAYGADGKVAKFSSRGPGHYKGKDTQKPDIAAPGVKINSSIPGGQYAEFSGTSMAQPHVTGALALLLQANPNLNPAQMRELLVKSSSPAPGLAQGQWTPEYGFGKLNIYNAFKMLTSSQIQSSSQFLSALTLKDPNALDADEFSAASLGEVDGEVDHFGETDTAKWDRYF